MKQNAQKKRKRGTTSTPFKETIWFTLVIVAAAVAILLVAGSFMAQWFLGSAAGQDFVEKYPGHAPLPEGTPEGFPWWKQWTHAVNIVLIVLLIRSGWLVRTQERPEAYWTRTNKGVLRTKGAPTKMSIYLWLHLTVAVLWLLNGVVYVALLIGTGHWARIVPTSVEIFPNAISAGLQYLSLGWPAEMAWTNYNAMQVLAYFITVFIAAPLSAITGVRMSPIWSNQWKISKYYPMPIARAVHFPVMIYFVLFIAVHVFLVFTTGMRHNLNFMFSNQGQTDSWTGFIVLLVLLVVVAAAWFLAKPMFLRSLAQLTGKVTSR